jgi:hypothetical protein
MPPDVPCPRCGRPSKSLVFCPECKEEVCAEDCAPLGKGKVCRDCEQGQTA